MERYSVYPESPFVISGRAKRLLFFFIEFARSDFDGETVFHPVWNGNGIAVDEVKIFSRTDFAFPGDVIDDRRFRPDL